MDNDKVRQMIIDAFRVGFRIGELRLARSGEMADANTIDGEAAGYALCMLDEEGEVIILTEAVR